MWKNRLKVEENIFKIQRNTKPGVKCEQCKFKSSLIQMKMHMRTVHGARPTKSQKRMTEFTPIVKPTKRVRKAKMIEIEQINNVKVAMKE